MSFNSGTAYPETINHYLGISETSYTWTVPAINATTCRIKIQVLDTIGNVICEDGSNNNFSIHSITLTFPNGGESFQGGSSQIIKWRTTIGQNFSHYRLLMSYNSDTTYADTIAHYVASSETLYNWQVPIINCNTVRIKVQILDDTNSVISQDNSNTNFAIDAEPPGLFSLVLPLNNGWTNATPRFIWQRAYDNFSMYNYELSISMPDETLLISTQDTINPIIPVGSVWQAKTSHANWSSREQHSSVVFDNKIWIIGG
ncbi:MAG: hypothetical protein KGZ86_06165, partial [Candidatus Latescibacteria bacterium]|nr:hypothetical protein [Candidatus Latescibacterota bacterium]